MNVRTICMAILYDGDATGYEIRKLSVEGEYSYFIDASYGSIYPALARLEQEKLVTSRVEQQDGKPAKKVYSITTAGRTAFIHSLFEKLGEDEFRSEFLLFLRFASELPQSLVEQRLNEKNCRMRRDARGLRPAETTTQPPRRRLGHRLRADLYASGS